MAKQDFNPVQGRLGNGPGPTQPGSPHGKGNYGIDRLGITSDSADLVPGDSVSEEVAAQELLTRQSASENQAELSAALAAIGQAPPKDFEQAAPADSSAAQASPENMGTLKSLRLHLTEFVPLLLAYKRPLTAAGTGLACLLMLTLWWVAHRAGPSPAAAEAVAASMPAKPGVLPPQGAKIFVSGGSAQQGTAQNASDAAGSGQVVLSLSPAGESKLKPQPVPGLNISPSQPALAGSPTDDPTDPLAADAPSRIGPSQKVLPEPAPTLADDLAKSLHDTAALSESTPEPAPLAVAAEPASPTSKPAAASQPALAAATSQPASQPAAASTPHEWRDCPPGFCLSGVMRMSDAPVAIINNRPAKIGSVIDGASVVRINEFSAELELDGKHFMLGITSGQPTQDRTANRPTKKSGKAKKPASRPAKPAEPDAADDADTGDAEF